MVKVKVSDGNGNIREYEFVNAMAAELFLYNVAKLGWLVLDNGLEAA